MDDPAKPRVFSFRTTDDLDLQLTHCAPLGHPNGRSVLLLHGASAGSPTFTSPKKTAPRGGLAAYLQQRGWDVWLLDWRGSLLLVNDAVQKHPPEKFSMDVAAQVDVPEAVKRVRREIERRPLAIVAHCLGSAALCMSIGAGSLDLAQNTIDRLVLSTVGLFFLAPWDGWFKAQDHTLERALIETPWKMLHCDAAKYPWPELVEQALRDAPPSLLPDLDDSHPFKRLAFMYGRPYLEGNVPDEIHSKEHPERLYAQFGGIPRNMFIHACQMMRSGFALPFDATSWSYSNEAPFPRGKLQGNANRYLHPERFEGPQITLLTGEHNMLWHRESVLTMRDWLLREGLRADAHVLPGYGHQDLFWKEQAPDDVFELIADAIA